MSDKFIEEVLEVPYVLGGRDMSGMDCWGLVVLAYAKIFNIDVPKYTGTQLSVSNSGTTSDDIKKHLEDSAPFTEVECPKYGDFALLSILGNPVHIGFMLGPELMLHTSEKTGTVCENIGGIKWKRRIKSFYRHKSML